MTEPVSLTFSLKYLVNFCKASGLSSDVNLKLSAEVPLLVEYPLVDGNSYLRFYLAPKVSSNARLDACRVMLMCADWRRRVSDATILAIREIRLRYWTRIWQCTALARMRSAR